MTRLHHLTAACAALVCLAAACPAIAEDEPNLTEGQIKEFLLTANVVQSHSTRKGVTAPLRLTLSDGKLTHDAAFQSVNQDQAVATMADGTTQVGFRDSYHFNIAAYELAKLIGLGDMIPATVQRKYRGGNGSLVWWVPAKMDEEQRLKEKLQPPDVNAWNKQVNRMWVFSQLVYDTDRNQGNMLITEDWKLFMIDFTRAFRSQHQLENTARLAMCDRQLLEKLRQLNEAEVLEKTKPHLAKGQVKAIMARRDLIVAFFEKRIAERGEKAVLY